MPYFAIDFGGGALRGVGLGSGGDALFFACLSSDPGAMRAPTWMRAGVQRQLAGMKFSIDIGYGDGVLQSGVGASWRLGAKHLADIIAGHARKTRHYDYLPEILTTLG